MPRLFVAVWPPSSVLDAVAALDRPDWPGLRWTTPDQWHVTLRFLGTCEVEAAETSLRAVVLPRASARLGEKATRLGRSVLALPVAGLDSLAASVIDATAAVGRRPEARPFRGHLTLARARHDLPQVRPSLPPTPAWSVTTVSLVESVLHPKGARYETIAAIPLTEG